MSDWLTAAIKKIEDMPQQAKDVRQAAMDDLFTFARLINPQRVYGAIMTKTNCYCSHEPT